MTQSRVHPGTRLPARRPRLSRGQAGRLRGRGAPLLPVARNARQFQVICTPRARGAFPVKSRLAQQDGSVFELIWLAQAIQDAMRSARSAASTDGESRPSSTTGASSPWMTRRAMICWKSSRSATEDARRSSPPRCRWPAGFMSSARRCYPRSPRPQRPPPRADRR